MLIKPWNLDELDSLIELSRQRWRVPGLAVAIVHDDAAVLTKGYGLQEIGKPDPVDTHTLFGIASCTKAFTATALAMLHEEGKPQWTDTVKKHLPSFQLYDPYATQEATILDLLTHRTGTPVANDIWYGTDLSREEVLAAVAARPGVSLRAEFIYSNIMYLAAGQLIPAITGVSYDDFIHARIFEPLGMARSSTSTHVLKQVANVATPHVWQGEAVTVRPWQNLDNVAPSGAINSSAAEMVQWMRLQLHGVCINGIQLLSPALVQLIQTPHTLVMPRGPFDIFFPDTSFLTYGLGCFVHEHYGHTVVEHLGVGDGMRAAVALVPAEGLGITILANLEWNGAKGSNLLPEALLRILLDDYLGYPKRDWHSRSEKTLAG